jgi:hypothetical protein
MAVATYRPSLGNHQRRRKPRANGIPASRRRFSMRVAAL